MPPAGRQREPKVSEADQANIPLKEGTQINQAWPQYQMFSAAFNYFLDQL